MSNAGFTFPPPPPPPPKKDIVPAADSGGYVRGSGGGSFTKGNDRGGGFPGRGRGFGGSARGNLIPRGGGRGHSSTGPATSHSGLIDRQEWTQGYSNRESSANGAMASNYGAQHGHFQSGPRPTSSSGTNHWNSPQKRDHATAFNHRGRGGSKPLAAPAVPSFLSNIPGLSPSIPSAILPVTPKIPAEKKLKARTSNTLGLNPSAQGLASEDEDEDEDEEAKLATTTTAAGQSGVAFEYAGQKATLKTPAEIAAWIADRKKRFPTAAKVEQAKKEAQEKQEKWEEEKKANQEARRLRRETYEREKVARLQEVARTQEAAKAQEVVGRLNTTESAKAPSEGSMKASEAAEKARLKTEKLIKKAAKAQRNLAKAQDALRKAQGAAAPHAATESIAVGSIDQMVGSIPDGEATLDITTTRDPSNIPPGLDDSDASSVLTDIDSPVEDEETSSSDSSSSDSSSDSGSDSAPETLTTKRTAPDRVPPPPRAAAAAAATASASTYPEPCRTMAKFGKCPRGKNCRFSHDPDLASPAAKQTRPDQAGKQRDATSQVTGRPKRKGLWEIMVGREKEEEARQVLRAIVEMGEKGMFESG